MQIDRKLVFNNLTFKNQEKLFDFASEELESKGYVRPSFKEAIKNREKEYPTGIELNNLNVALAHTDSDHVVKNNIMVFKLPKPVKFKSMETLENIDVNLVFILLLNDPSLHLKVLRELAGVLQDSDYLEKLNNAVTQEELYDLLKRKKIMF